MNETVLILTDKEIEQLGLAFEMQVGCLLSNCMRDPPHDMNWPRLISEVPADAKYSASAQGTWRQMRKYSAELGGGAFVVVATDSMIPVGYSHCMVLSEQTISDFQLNDESLEIKAAPGDLLLTFAGLAPKYRGARLDDDNQTVIFSPEGGWEDGQEKPGVGLYQKIYELRLKNHAQGKRVWNRTHPDRDSVRFMGSRFGLKVRGQLMVPQAGIMTPKVIMCTDGKYQNS